MVIVMSTWKEFIVNGITVIFRLDTKRHIWVIGFDNVDVVLTITKAKGNAVITFLEKLKEIEK